jgi:CBS domain-containing protein
MSVKAVMNKSRRQVMPDTSIAEAMLLMRYYQCDSLPVAVDKELVGYIHLRDLLALFIEEKLENLKQDSDFHPGLVHDKYAPLTRVSVKQVMVEARKSLLVLKPVDEPVNLMLAGQISSTAVANGSGLKSIISLDNVNEVILKLISTKVAA